MKEARGSGLHHLLDSVLGKVFKKSLEVQVLLLVCALSRR